MMNKIIKKIKNNINSKLNNNINVKMLNNENKKQNYILPKNTILNILNIYCKSKKKTFIKMANLTIKNKKIHNIQKIFKNEKKTHAHKRITDHLKFIKK